MRFVRVWLPVLIIAAGLVAIVATGGSLSGVEGGVAIIAAGMSVWLLNVIFRVGVQGERERDAEDAARDFYAEHGYWPDEAPPDAAPPGAPPGDPHRADPHHTGGHDPRPHAGRSGSPARRPPRRP
jgi:hypothetical protein